MDNDNFLIRKQCPGCDSTRSHTLYSCPFLDPPIKGFLESSYLSQGGFEPEYLRGAHFILNECLACGLIYQKEIPDDRLMRRLYTQWIGPKINFQTEVTGRPLDYHAAHAQEIMTLIAYFGRLPAELKFLDVGMGWGNWARMAKSFGCDSYGTELSREKMDFAASQGITILGMNDLASYSFDFINLEHILEHVADPFAVLSQLTASLKPGGLIKVDSPDGGLIKKRLQLKDWMAPKGSKHSLNAVSPLEHINCFNWRSMIRLADRAGLKTVKLPLGIQYRFGTNWKPGKPFLKNLLKPAYVNVFKRSTRLFFCLK